MNECEILIQNGYEYIKFKNIEEFKIYKNIVRGFWIDEDGYYATQDKNLSTWNSYDGEGKTIEENQIEEELKLNLDWVLKIMENIDE